MPREIFISYSQSDRNFALELLQHIEALSAARVLVRVLSGSSNDSPQDDFDCH